MSGQLVRNRSLPLSPVKRTMNQQQTATEIKPKKKKLREIVGENALYTIALIMVEISLLPGAQTVRSFNKYNKFSAPSLKRAFPHRYLHCTIWSCMCFEEVDVFCCISWLLEKSMCENVSCWFVAAGCRLCLASCRKPWTVGSTWPETRPPPLKLHLSAAASYSLPAV